MQNQKRKPLPAGVAREVLFEAGYRCSVPSCRTILTIDLHHIDQVADGGGNEVTNLIALCPNDHRLFHAGVIPRDAIRTWKQMLVALNAALDRESVDLLIFLSTRGADERPLDFSADGVLRFARLIGSGLAADRRWSFKGEWVFGRYAVELTPRGAQVINAWKRGELQGLREALDWQTEHTIGGSITPEG